MKSDPSRAVTVDQMRERLASEQAKRNIGAMESESFASVWDAIEATPEAAAEMKRRSTIMMALQEHITRAGMTETQAAKILGVAASRISDLVNGKFNQFDLDELVRMALAAGLTVSHEVLMQFDAAEWLTNDEAISPYLADTQEAGDTDFIAHAQEVAEQAKVINRSKKSKSHG
ncbi:MAG: XRE family transcriptional regulator [Rhodoferax sp.]|uniref:XRE family transcriptional regulator n=2 Tax=Rhodoferax sp. TaxID=50421 RepID=UPI003263C023